jgi:hypothetical protein
LSRVTDLSVSHKNRAMTDQDQEQPALVVVTDPAAVGAGEQMDEGESIERPAKVMRIGSMIKQLLDELEKAPLDATSRNRLREIYERSVAELSEGLSPELRDELHRLSLPFETDEPSEAELRIAHAQLVGWLEGLFHGIQAALFAQQLAAQNQLQEMRRRSLPAARTDEGPAGERPGQYL